jgi:hypothetical protein
VKPRQIIRSDALGGAVARYAPDGDRPAQAVSLEQCWRRAPAYDDAETSAQREADRRNGYDMDPARRIGYR